jgi:hypothetical protein
MKAVMAVRDTNDRSWTKPRLELEVMGYGTFLEKYLDRDNRQHSDGVSDYLSKLEPRDFCETDQRSDGALLKSPKRKSARLMRNR